MSKLIGAAVTAWNPVLKRRIAELESSQWLQRTAVLDAQMQRLRALLAHCETNVPYYRDVFRRAGLRAADVRTTADLAGLPFLSKPILQEQGERLVAGNVPRQELLRNHSGGSTGTMTSFFLDRYALHSARAAQWRFYRWAGLQLGEPHVYVWGAPGDLAASRRLRARIQNHVLRRWWFDAFSLSGATLADAARAIERRRPRVISGYASALGRLAEHCAATGVRFRALKGVVSTAEVLSNRLRRDLEATFGVPVYNRYGCGEMKDIAQDCGAGVGMHVNADNVLVEIDGASGTDGRGEIVVTNLVNYAMPLVRYRLGDVGELLPDACPCGRGLPLMRLASGRVSEGVLAMDGTWVHGEYFTHLFYGIQAVRQFQLTQHALDDIEVRVRAGEGFGADTAERLKQAIAAKLPGARIRLVVTDDLECSPSGKYLFVRSMLRPVPRTAG